MNATPTLQLQSIIYNNNKQDIARLVTSIRQSVILAKNKNLVSKVIYIIGDCSPKQSIVDPLEWVAGLSDDVLEIQYVFFDENLGHGGGQNRLGLDSEYDILGLINPDVVASPHLVENLISELSDDVAIAEAAQIPMEHPKDFDQSTLETTFATGCCFFIHQDIFKKINGFDHKNFFMYCDDVDLSWRIRLLGKKIHYVPKAFVYHDHRIDETNTLVVGHAEFYYSALGSLMLATKWGNQERADQIINNLKNDPAYKDVYEEYSELSDNNMLPEVIKNAESVAIFTPTGFANYRWRS